MFSGEMKKNLCIFKGENACKIHKILFIFFSEKNNVKNMCAYPI